MTFSSDNSQGVIEPEDNSIGFSISNAPANLYYLVTLQGPAVTQVTLTFDPVLGEGKVRLVGAPPGTMGAGTYTSTAKIEFCIDSGCTQQVNGSPVTLDITYTVTGSSLPLTSLYWLQSPPEGAVLNTAETRSPTVKLTVSARFLPYEGVYLFRTSSTNGLVTSATFGQPSVSTDVGVAFGEYTLTLKPPASIGSGVFTDTMSFRACFDQACARPVPDSEYTLSLWLLIPATEGVEFTRRNLALSQGATDLAWSESGQSLYVASSLYASNGPTVGLDPKVIQVNPLTMQPEATTTLSGENLQNIAVSDDGAYLYVGSKTQPLLHRLLLPSLAPDLTVTFGNFNTYEPNLVYDLSMISGQPRSFVVSLRHNNSGSGTYVYDDSTPRAGSIAPDQSFARPRWLLPSGTSGSFISQSYGESLPKVHTLDRLTLGVGGISVASSVSVTSGVVLATKPARVGNRLYSIDGRVVDATTGALLGTLAFPQSEVARALVADEARGLVFAWGNILGKDYIYSFDSQTLELLALAPAFEPYGWATAYATPRMILWGSDGIALTSDAGLVVLSGAFFTTYRGAPSQ